jgi:hypothetical protein
MPVPPLKFYNRVLEYLNAVELDIYNRCRLEDVQSLGLTDYCLKYIHP